LTRARPVATIGPMTRDTLTEILKRARGVEGTKNGFDVPESHELSFYIATEGDAILVTEVSSIAFQGSFLEIESRKLGTVFVAYEDVRAVSVKATKGATTTNRAGFE